MKKMERMIECRTSEGEIIKVPCRLMIQSRIFAHMLKCLSPFGDDYEEANDVQLDVFPLNDIGKDCFEQIIKWMEEHDEKPDPVIRDDPGTGERIWFELTDWERKFFNVELETLKEYYMAAYFLGLKSLYHHCAQEIARLLMEKNTNELIEAIRVLGIGNEDTPEVEANIRRFDQNRMGGNNNGGQA